MPVTVVEILDKSLSKVAEIRNLYPIDKQANILRYSRELSDFGQCLFRVSSQDPIFDELGDILQPHIYNVRITHNGTKVWQGAIIDNPQRTKNFIEVRALEYEFYLDKILIRRTSKNPATNQADGLYRIFNTGTMSSNLTTVIQNAASDFGTNHPLSSLTVGTIDNPSYPLGFTDANGNSLTGAWNFSDFISLQFDFHTAYYVTKAFADYTQCDFEVDENLVFSFKTFLGTKQQNLTFTYGVTGNVVDYNLPRLGKRMVNDLWGVAADINGKVLHSERIDSESINTYGKLESDQAFTDVKDNNFLKTRLGSSLLFINKPESSPVNIVVNEKGYFLGLYDIGDIVTVKIKDNVIDFNEPRRIVGITVTLHNTGRELTTIQTNTPLPGDLS